MNREYFIHIYIISSIIVFTVTYYVVDRIMLRATQIGNNTLDVDFTSQSLGYAIGVTVVFGVIYWLFVRDMRKDASD